MLSNESLNSKEELNDSKNDSFNEIDKNKEEINDNKQNFSKSHSSLKSLNDEKKSLQEISSNNSIRSLKDISSNNSKHSLKNISLNDSKQSLQKINSYTSNKSCSSRKGSQTGIVNTSGGSKGNISCKSRSGSYMTNISKSQSIVKETDIQDTEFIDKINKQLKESIDHHLDYYPNYLFTSNSIIGINKNNVFSEPRFPTKEEAPVWKTDLLLNNKTKALIESLGYYEPISSIYTAEQLTLTGEDSYGYFTIFIREAKYNDEPCYYVCTDTKIYEKGTSNIIADKVLIAYVSTTLHTLNQVTREYIGKCEDQDYINHYILTKYRITDYKTENQKIVASIYDENYYKENSKVILAPHILTEAGEEVLSRILGLILDEDPEDQLLDSIEFISYINDELRIIKFNIKAENEVHFNGLESKKMNEIKEEKLFNKYLNKMSKKHEIEEMKIQYEEMKNNATWENMSGSYDYLNLSTEITDFKNKIDQKEEQYRLEEEREKEEEEKTYKQEYELELNSDDEIIFKNVSSIKKIYKSIDRDKYFINITLLEEENKSKSPPPLENNDNKSSSNLFNSDNNSQYSSFRSMNNSKEFSSKTSNKSNLSNSNSEDNIKFIGSIENTNNPDNLVIDKSISNSSIQSKNNVSDMNKQDSLLLKESIIDDDNSHNDNEINVDEKTNINSTKLSEKPDVNSKNNSTELLEKPDVNSNNNSTEISEKSDANINDNSTELSEKPDESINNNSIELPEKKTIPSEKYLNEIENIKKSLSKITTGSLSFVEPEKDKNENTLSVEEVINMKKQENTESLGSLNSKNSSNQNSSTHLNENLEKSSSINSTNEPSFKENNETLTSRSNTNISDDHNEMYQNEISKDNSLEPISNTISKNNSINQILKTESENDIENITDKDIENEIKELKKESNSANSINLDKSFNSSLKSINSNHNSDKIEEIKPQKSLLLNEIENILEKELSEDPLINEVKNNYGLDVPQTILYPYVEYNYIHQKGYLRIYSSKMKVSFNSELLNVKDKRIKHGSSKLLENPDVKSEYLTVKDKTKEKYTKYINNNPDLKKTISDYLQLLLSKKPKDVYNKEILFGNEEYLISKSGIDKKIDNLINGGILQGEIIELVGSPSTGKTQLSFLLSLNVLLSDIKNTVLYLDTKNSFSIKRIIDFYYSKNNKIEKHSEDIKDLISRIKHQGVYNYHELFNILEEIMKDISHNINNNIGKFNKNLKLIVINSISSLIFPIIGQDYTRNSVMSSISQYLNILSRTYKISILLTNFTVGAKYSNIYNNPTNTLEYYNKKRNLYEHQKICNIKIKDVILKQYQQNHPQNQYPPNEKKKELFINENEEIIAQLINELNDDFSQCIEVNKTTNNIIIRDFKKPSLGNIWTYTPDIQLFLTSLSSPLSSSHINHQKNVNNINNKQNNYNINEITQNSKRQKLNNNDEEIIKKIEVVLSHRTNIGQYCTFCINKNGIS
ncbi:hypothetical protein LY90DRAFT_672255 [Neocallimastix californiae]|uniref:RecA family profile 1 domain-containing protein n=1 Tax=Neocallimastix californiae TaxID=1754190 RepID=A0A1Y2BZC6_9FUNG|nr:hypothetical protein LY90DRAFT_672255 [Neocallimastix californiae]|eukprot:ORY40024.1 hypothetical protein LY90DRAFT_672255 [Neocallimastix californiae]